MSFTDDIRQKCPYCGFEASLKFFGTWEKPGKRGLLGKTPDGFIVFLCPRCDQQIVYNSLTNIMSKKGDERVNEFFYKIFRPILYYSPLLIIAVIVFLIIKYIL